MWSPELYLKAYHFAARAHRGQTVPGTDIAYLMHLSFVAMEVIGALRDEPGRDEDLAVQCALLHDVIEDTAVDHDAVAGEFGLPVADGVRALTKEPGLAKADAITDSLRRIRAQPREVWMVKLADRITNLQPPPPGWTREKCQRYRAQAMEILEGLGGASPYLAARLRAKIDAYPIPNPD